LFRRVPIRSPEDFRSAAQAIAREMTMPYRGGDSPRRELGTHVYTSTELPPDVQIPLHNELSFRAIYPRHLFFYCAEPAPVGGESLIGDARVVYRRIDPVIRERFETRGLCYTHTFTGDSAVSHALNRLDHVQRTWIEVFETSDKAVVEERCIQLGMTPIWRGDTLVASCHRPGTTVHPITGETVWFNQAHLMQLSPKLLNWPRYIEARLAFLLPNLRLRAVAFGDGSRIPRAYLDHVLNVLERHSSPLAMERGDLIALDNILCMHGRRSFRGRRKVWATMTR
jgi:hypothetical protein